MDKSQTCERDIGQSDWLCDECFSTRVVRQGKYQTIRDEVLVIALKQLEEKGACMVKDAISLYKGKILDKHVCTISDNECESYRKIIKT